MRFFLFLIFISASFSVVAAPKILTLYEGGLTALSTFSTGKAFRVQDGENGYLSQPGESYWWNRYEFSAGTIAFERNLSLGLGGSVEEIGKYGGFGGHVLCDGLWLTYESQLMISEPGGWFTLETIKAEDSRDLNNMDAFLYCRVENATGDFVFRRVGKQFVGDSAGSFRCATGGLESSIDSGPGTRTSGFKWNEVGVPANIFDDFPEGGAPWVNAFQYTEEDKLNIRGTITIPREC